MHEATSQQSSQISHNKIKEIRCSDTNAEVHANNGALPSTNQTEPERLKINLTISTSPYGVLHLFLKR
jgi:hypothetical protein